MGRILAIDYGLKRVGLAVTDPLQIVPRGLGMVPSSKLFEFLENYLSKEKVDIIVVGYPKQMNNIESQSMQYIKPMVGKLRKKFHDIEIVLYDERFTSCIAQKTIITAGIKKKRRREDKGLVDEISAVIILRDFIDSNRHKLNI